MINRFTAFIAYYVPLGQIASIYIPVIAGFLN